MLILTSTVNALLIRFGIRMQPYIMQTLRGLAVPLVKFRLVTCGWEWARIHRIRGMRGMAGRSQLSILDLLPDRQKLAETLQILSSQAYMFKEATFVHEQIWDGRKVTPYKGVYRFTASTPDVNLGFMGSMMYEAPIPQDSKMFRLMNARLQLLLKDAYGTWSMEKKFVPKPALYVDETPR